MKALHFLLLATTIILFSCPQGHAQLEYFLPDSNAYFSVSPYKFWIQGDTTFEGKIYKKVYEQYGDSAADITRAIYYAAVREDTLEERIYCMPSYENTERLIADFSLNPGDGAMIYTFFPYPRECYIAIDFKDSILINNNYRMRLGIDWHEDIEYWIEGIGSTFGLFFPGAEDAFYEIDVPFLLCVHVNDTIIYDNPGYESCYFDFYVGIEDNKKINFNIYPSPSNDKIFISSNTLFPTYSLTYKIFDLRGIPILSGNMAEVKEIDISVLVPGTYTIQFTRGKDVYLSSSRFMKY